jgi:hypothetical protein
VNDFPQPEGCQPMRISRRTNASSADQIDLICDTFEQAWVRGESPQIEAHLEKFDGAERELLLAELLLVERELRIRQGQTASRLEYRQRFPEYSTVIDRLEFSTIDDRSGKGSSALRRSALSSAGQKLADFELVEELGSGGSGTVWKATDSRLRRTVAIKIPHHGSMAQFERARYLREGQAAAQLQHPNIVSVYEVGEDRGQVFIVSEYVHGLNLRDSLKRGRPSFRAAAELVALLAEALQHAHDQGVIHRDLKPANVLIDAAGCPHITDFGLAKWAVDAASTTVEGNILGTPGYMSPEQARGDTAKVDRRSDVYGLGALFYEMIAGTPPFQGGDVATIVHRVIHQEPRAPRQINAAIPSDLETICLKAMEKDPNRRYQSAHELAIDLRRFLTGRTIEARRAGRLECVWKACVRRPATAVAGILGAMAIVGAISSALLATDRSRLQGEKSRLEGFQQVHITTEPIGAMVAIVPIDVATGEPTADPTKVIRPSGLSPVDVSLKHGEYFVEVALFSGDTLTGIAEVYRTVPRSGDDSVALSHLEWKANAATGTVELRPIRVMPTSLVSQQMATVQFDERLTRRRPDLPQVLYVDSMQTLPGTFQDGQGNVIEQNGFDAVVERLELTGKRLPTEVELEAIAEQEMFGGRSEEQRQQIYGLADAYPEFTSTRFAGTHLAASVSRIISDLIVLKGFERSQLIEGYTWSGDGTKLIQARGSSMLPTAFRGVRSAAPRFIARSPQGIALMAPPK